MKKEITKALEAINYFPLNKKNKWMPLVINHQKPKKGESSKTYKHIRDNVKKYDGIYIFKDRSNRTLYIGKGKPIANRLIDHYKKSFTAPSKDSKYKKWNRFFSAYKGKLTVYWKEIEDEKDRIVIEQMLTYILNPKFIDFHVKR